MSFSSFLNFGQILEALSKKRFISIIKDIRNTFKFLFIKNVSYFPMAISFNTFLKILDKKAQMKKKDAQKGTRGIHNQTSRSYRGTNRGSKSK